MNQQEVDGDPLIPGRNSHRVGFVRLEDRRLYNSKAHISKLSDDILSYIFNLVAHADFASSHIPSVTIRHSSQVIKKWRDVALNYPLLWAASLDFLGSVKWIQEVVKRAGSSPVTLTYPALVYNVDGNNLIPRFRLASYSLFKRSDASDEKFTLALSLCSRARHITLQITDMDANSPRWRTVIENLTKSSPYLETFTLFQSRPFLYGQPYTLPTTLFNGQAAQLRSLTLIKSRCHLKSPAFQKLSMLSVADVHPGHMALEWLEIIAGLPELEILALENSFCEDRVTISDTECNVTGNLREVVLPKLQMLILTGICSACSVIFTHLGTPSSCGMRISCLSTKDDTHYHAMMGAVQNKLLTFTIPRWKEKGVSVMCTSKGLAFSNNRQSLSHQASFLFHWSTDRMVPVAKIIPSFLFLLHGIFSDSAISDLHLDLEPYDESCSVFSELTDIHPQDLQSHQETLTIQVLRVFDKVQILRIYQSYVVPFLLRLIGASEGVQSTILPSLKQMSFHNLTFGEKSWASSMSNVIDFIYERANIEKPIEIAEFIECGGISLAISELKVLGLEVEWDGKDHIFDQGIIPEWYGPVTDE